MRLESPKYGFKVVLKSGKKEMIAKRLFRKLISNTYGKETAINVKNV